MNVRRLEYPNSGVPPDKKNIDEDKQNVKLYKLSPAKSTLNPKMGEGVEASGSECDDCWNLNVSSNPHFDLDHYNVDYDHWMKFYCSSHDHWLQRQTQISSLHLMKHSFSDCFLQRKEKSCSI